MCLSETYFDSSTPDNLIDIERCNLVPADHADKIKKVKFEFTTNCVSLFEL